MKTTQHPTTHHRSVTPPPKPTPPVDDAPTLEEDQADRRAHGRVALRFGEGLELARLVVLEEHVLRDLRGPRAHAVARGAGGAGGPPPAPAAAGALCVCAGGGRTEGECLCLCMLRLRDTHTHTQTVLGQMRTSAVKGTCVKVKPTSTSESQK